MDDVGEYIERFAGYLRLLENEERIKPLLEGKAPDLGIDLSLIPEQPLPPPSDPVLLAQTAGAALPLPAANALPSSLQTPNFASNVPMLPSARLAESAPYFLPHSYASGSSAAMSDYVITIKYFAIGSQLIHIRQLNVLEDGDTILENPEAGRPSWADVDTNARRATLLEDPNLPEVAAELVSLRDTIADPVTFPAALRVVLDAQVDAAQTGDPEAEGSESWLATLAVESEGIWLNGVLTDTPPERPDFSKNDRPSDPDLVSATDLGSTVQSGDSLDLETEGRNGLERPGMEAELGGNLALSSATIRDTNDVGGTLVVMGNVHDLSVIWQTNILSDVDEAHLAGPVNPLTAGTNVLTNLAHFQTDLSLIAPGAVSAVPLAPRWNVDVVEGDLVDFNMLIQHNMIRDGDLSVQHAETGFQRFVLGENESVSMSDLTVLRDYYDVIFVGGDMVRANMIFQDNMVIDDDTMRVIGTGAEGTAATLGGGNTLWNEAWIHRSGTDIFTSVTDGAWDFLDVLTGREGTLDDPPDLAVPAGGNMPLRVLFVEGDYLDVNAIHQTNEIHDADAALQLGVGEMSLSTGGNTAANVAQIFDVRGQGNVAMVEGEHYDDEMMIQTNILAEDQDVRTVDAQTLASEVIAFLDPDLVTEPDADGQFNFIPMHAGDDMMSGIMA
ncbi:hypothetical protein HTT03_09720 [Sulfitobacter sp. S0837]|uniref:hypothetical protein n=1 Tax=Sulfitobacter maritimus TaxID=2741719 RepID=UPI001582405A|nr:hypothetical protein [Sulfitobacter maritimus]NUH65560.1 hypothetical protein [Sulfitobacter maritimus]